MSYGPLACCWCDQHVASKGGGQPWPKLFTCDVGLFGLTTVPLPLTKAHEPTAGEIALFAAKVVLFVGRHRSCAGPALAMG